METETYNTLIRFLDWLEENDYIEFLSAAYLVEKFDEATNEKQKRQPK